MRDLLERLLAGAPPGAEPLTHVEELPERLAQTAAWPAWAPDTLLERLAANGITTPWTHQIAAAEAAFGGQSVVVATGTASGKSLAYQLPALTALLEDDHARVLYLSPTKALAGDQLRALTTLGIPGLRPATYDGDTPIDERDWVRAHANWVLTNPDMLHRGMLPAHGRWASYFRRLRYIVVDECHSYRGLFGSHVAQILRRLRRVCASYGSAPTFVLASATAATPAESASRLVGLPVTAVSADGSPHGATVFGLWEPPLTALRGENDAPVRRAAGAEAARLLADLVIEGARTLTFIRSRRGAELTAMGAQRLLREAGLAELVPRIAAYRSGYLPEERRALEAALTSGELLGVAATNALELGLDVSGLDAVVLAGFPGTLASLWQQAGRAGRSGSASLVLFVARDDPLDTYLVHHPEAVFGRPVEATVFDPLNPYVLAPQLCCAAAELPLRPADLEMFGGPAAEAVLAELVSHGILRRRPGGWFWTARERPSADIRGSGGPPVAIIEAATGALIGTVDAGAAHSTVHTGAVYLHQGRTFVVDELDLDESAALVHPDEPTWTTSARDITDIAVVSTESSVRHGPVSVNFGTVDVTNQVVSYARRQISTSEVLDEIPLDLPARELRTRAVWYTVTPDALLAAGIAPADVPGAAHAAEHAAIGLLPLFATCDRWDIGGVSTALHPDTGEPTVFVYDGHAGGAGFAERGHGTIVEWLGATRVAIASCECVAGCPSCVQSPKCGNGNEPLDKRGAVLLLDLVLSSLRTSSRRTDSARPGGLSRATRSPLRDDGVAAGPGARDHLTGTDDRQP
ncbi:MAG: box helicase protein [Pseudonocardiales bacterium]|nr:box helicase protein [Pseudonocardiales bacterium]